jgi:hypothetical protein
MVFKALGLGEVTCGGKCDFLRGLSSGTFQYLEVGEITKNQLVATENRALDLATTNEDH